MSVLSGAPNRALHRGQPKLEFVVEPFTALIEALRQSPHCAPQPLRIQLQTIWDKSECDFPGVLKSLVEGSQIAPSDNSERLVLDAKDAIATSIPFQEFSIELSKSGDLPKAEWQIQLQRSAVIMQNLTGIDFSKKPIVVQVLHPGLPAGRFDPLNQKVYWRYVGNEYPDYKPIDYFPNYNVVYLWHERMHAELPFDDLEHAVIQLMTDNELRIQLNGGSYPPFVGHPDLTLKMEAILPDWKAYVTAKRAAIFKFIDELQAKV